MAAFRFSLFLLAAIASLLGVVDAGTVTSIAPGNGFCKYQAAAGIAANPTAPVMYACPKKGSPFYITFTMDVTAAASCAPTYDGASPHTGSTATFTYRSSSASGFNFGVNINSNSVTPGSLHLLKFSSGACSGTFTADFYFYVQFLAAPVITGVTVDTTNYNNYCHRTSNTAPSFAVDDCYKDGGSITLSGNNLGSTLKISANSPDEDPVEEIPYYCGFIGSRTGGSLPTWDTTNGVIIPASTAIFKMNPFDSATASSPDGTMPYEEGKRCYVETNQGQDTTNSISFSWFTEVTTLTSLTATSGICDSSGNNLINCLQFGSSGAQAITFNGANFGPSDAPISLTGINQLCTTSTLTRISDGMGGENRATCILLSATSTQASPVVATPTILTIGTTSSGVSSPTATYGYTTISGVSCSSCGCVEACDYDSSGGNDSMCGCWPSVVATAIGTITLQGANFRASGTYDACDSNGYTSSDGLSATCTGAKGDTGGKLPATATSAVLAYRTNNFASNPVITTPITWKSESSGTNYFDITVTFTPRLAGGAYVRLHSDFTPTELQVRTNPGGNTFKCSASFVAVNAAESTSVTLTDCPAAINDRVYVYVDGDNTGTTNTNYGTFAKSAAITWPTIVSSISASACSGQCTIDSVQHLCGCPTSGFTVTVHAQWSSTPTDAAICGSNTITADSMNGYYTCTLGSTGTVGGSITSSNKGSRNKIYFVTNSFSAGPTISSTSWVSGTTYQVVVKFTAPNNGLYTVGIISDSDNTAGTYSKSNGYNLDFGTLLCQSSALTTPNTITGGVEVTATITNCPAGTQKGYAKVYIEGSTSGYTSGISGTVGTSGQILLPHLVTSIEAVTGCQATVSTHPAGCNIDGASASIKVYASNLAASSPTDSGLCAGSITFTPNAAFYTCTLKGGTIGGTAVSSNAGDASAKTVEYWTNSFSSTPTLGTIAYTGDGSTDLYSVPFTFTASVAGRYAAALVTGTQDGTWTYANTRAGDGTLCELDTLTSMTTSATTYTLTGCSMTSGTTYYVHVYIEGSSQTAATGVNAKTAAVTLPPVVSSITLSSGTCQQCSSASGKGTTNLCACPLAGGDSVTINGKNLASVTENSLCASSTQANTQASSFTCTLASSSAAGTSKTVGFTITSYGTVRAYYISNQATALSVPSAPSSVSVGDYKTTFTVSFTAATAGTSWIVAYASSGNNYTPSMAALKANTAGGTSGVSFCVATNSGTASNTVVGTNTFTFTCGGGTAGNAFALDTGYSTRVFVYAEGSGDVAADYYGSVSSVLTVAVCHPDCVTCSRSEIGYCLTCGTSPANQHLEDYEGKKYCCLAECLTCGPKIGASSTLTSDSCRSCNFDTPQKYHLSRDGGSPTFCCHGSCSSCTGNTATQCTSCGGYNTRLYWYGACKNGTVEIHGDPHFSGYLDQDYTITGRPSAVYSIITDEWLQYNTRFIWYGDVYHGFDPTTNKPYDANVTYIGEIGMKFNWGDHEDRIHITSEDFTVRLNGYTVPADSTGTKFGVDCSIVQGKKFIDIETPKFRVRFFLAGSRKHPFINQRVELLQWRNLHSHGLLGQTWKVEQRQGINRNQIWEGHQAGVDFQFQSAEFLEGRLIDYEVQEDTVFGDTFQYNLYHFKGAN